MPIYKMFVCLCLSALTLLGGYSLNVSAEEATDYPVIYSVGNVGEAFSYISMVKTENDVWDRFIDDVTGFIGDADSYLIGFNTDTIVVGWGNISWSPSNVNLIICENYRYTFITDDQWYVGAGNNPFLINNVLPIAMQGVPVSAAGSVSANFENYNAVTWDMAVNLYQNSNSGDSSQAIIDTINNQWAIDDGEDFGTDSLVTELEGKLGVLGFASDTLIQFVDLFDISNVGSTSLIFPSFSLNVQGQNYTIWDEVSFDMNSIYNDFTFLIDTVRTILTLFVWLAVFNYCVKSYERVVNR